MADACPNFSIRQILVQPIAPGLASAGGTPIVPPIACTEITIQNTDASNALTLFTDPANLTGSSKTIAASASLTLRASALCFGAGAPVAYVAGASGIQPCTLTFLR